MSEDKHAFMGKARLLYSLDFKKYPNDLEY